MRILYYLEPFEELGKPLFRLPTIRRHLESEIRSLLVASPAPQVAMLCSEPVAAAARAEALLEGVQLLTLSQSDLHGAYPTYLEASARWYDRSFGGHQLSHMVELCAARLGSFVPDVIVCYESNAPFLAALFPDALFLHNTFGIFSRAPYPETSALDPFGIGKDSYLQRYADKLRSIELGDQQRASLERLKQAYRSAQLQQSPVRREQVRGDFSRVVLLPLQVSRYFMYDGNCPEELRGGTQRDLVRYVVERVESDTAVYVTMHGNEDKLFDAGFRRDLAARFENVRFSEDLQRIPWVSQHILPHVDAVVTVSSSVGLQALIWDLPVIALGRSHVAGIAAAHSLDQLPRLLAEGRTRRFDGALYHLLTHYYPLARRYHHDGAWYLRFLQRSIAKKRAGLDFDFFDPIDEPQAVMQALIDELRPELYARELKGIVRAASAEQLAMRDLKETISKADLVSFDVFDTLVTRSLFDPRSVFDLMAPSAERLLGEHGVVLSVAFRVERERAARLAADHAKAAGREEYTLAAVYEQLCHALAAPAELAQQLERMEEQTELTIHQSRASGRELFEHAQRQQTRVVLISDMFLKPNVLAEILARCGYAGYEALYVSSEYGLLKRSGNLFEKVRELERNPRRWVHVGDNPISDVKAPKRLGIDAHQLPSISDLYASDRRNAKLWPARHLSATLGASLLHGVVSRRFYDRPFAGDRRAHFDGSAYRLGFEGGGPLILSFVSWLIERARRERLTDLYFLARDGYLPMQVYQLLAPYYPDAPRAHYLYASRRAYSTAALYTERDVVASVETPFNAMSLESLLKHRFAVPPERVVPGSIEAAGFSSLADAPRHAVATERSQLLKFLTSNAGPILENAARERDALLQYLDQEGLRDKERKPAVVDLGHNASLQEALAKLTGRPTLGGYYFATFIGAYRRYMEGLPMEGYLLEFEHSQLSEHCYCRNVGLFEFLFLPQHASLVRMERDERGVPQPVFVVGDESKRARVIEDLHRGILDFCKDALSATCGQPHLFNISKTEAIRTFAAYADAPDRPDAAIVDGVSFIDSFAGLNTRYVIASPLFAALNPLNYPDYYRASWWKPGAQAMAGRLARFNADGDRPAWERKLRKFLRDPKAFVADMPLSRRLKKLVVGRSGIAR